MYLLVVELKMELEWSNSLKEKRRAKLSLMEKLKKNFNLNVSEIGFKDESKIINLGVSLVNGDMDVLKNIDSKLRAFIESNSEGKLFFYKSAFIDWSWE